MRIGIIGAGSIGGTLARRFKALGHDVWGKSKDVIKLIDDARASGQNITANNYPWLASHTGLDAALIPRWASDGGDEAMLKRFDDPALMAK